MRLSAGPRNQRSASPIRRRVASLHPLPMRGVFRLARFEREPDTCVWGYRRAARLSQLSPPRKLPHCLGTEGRKCLDERLPSPSGTGHGSRRGNRPRASFHNTRRHRLAPRILASPSQTLGRRPATAQSRPGGRFAGASAGGFAVPTYVDIPAMVGRYGSSTIESKGLLHEVSLRLKCRASVVQTCIKHRRAGLTSFRVQWSSGFCRLRSIPGNMHTIPFAYGNLGPPNCTNRDGASLLAVDPNRRGKSSPEVFRSGIKNIALFWVAREIDQVDDAFRHSCLRL
jgi:hypothetical protein